MITYLVGTLYVYLNLSAFTLHWVLCKAHEYLYKVPLLYFFFPLRVLSVLQSSGGEPFRLRPPVSPGMPGVA